MAFGKELPVRLNFVLFLLCIFVILAISSFGGGIQMMIAPVPINCLFAALSRFIQACGSKKLNYDCFRYIRCSG